MEGSQNMGQLEDAEVNPSRMKEQGMTLEAGDVELATCGLAPSVLSALLKSGFRYKSDVRGLSARELSNESGISASDASAVLNTATSSSASGLQYEPVTALELLKEQQQLSTISTLLPALDGILGGGFARGELTELCGPPGSGKTQLGLHACIAAQCQFTTNVDVRFAVVYIDTEGSFVVDRVAAMAEAMIEKRPDLASRGVDRDELLRGIHYFRTHDFVEQMEVMNALPELLHARPEIQLIVMDSVAFHFRHGFEEFSQRVRALDNMAALLHHVAVEYNVAVVLINQVTSRSGGASRSGSTELPSLGETWAYSITNRLVLSWEGEMRSARVTKSSSLARGSSHFQVVTSGVDEPLD